MNNAERPKGIRYSLLYVERGDPLGDQPRARRRVAALTENLLSERAEAIALAKVLRQEIGVEIAESRLIGDFFRTAEVVDFLNSITVTAKCLEGAKGRRFISEASRIFKEENLAYRIDEEGGVHPIVNSEFVRGVEAAIASLSGQQYQAARAYFEQALEDFSGAAPDGKAAIRHVFLAAETVFKLIAPGNPQRLGTAELRAMLPAVHAQAGEDRAARIVAEKALDGFAKWVEAAHFYRHAQKEEEPSEPPLPLVIFMLSTGAAHIRWLVSLGTE